LEQKRDRRIVGQCTIESLEWEAAAHVGILGILIQKQYRDCGLGFALIQFAIQHAKATGKKKINLTTFETNQRGIALYKKCGFQTVGHYSRQYLIQKKYIDELIMERWLDE
jgi:RimJ/RimL family protein N-acetyltransferase